MGYKQLYYCKACNSWHEINPEKSLRGCPQCGEDLKYVPVNYDAYSSWDLQTRQKFQSDYLTSPETVVNVQHSYKKDKQEEENWENAGGCMIPIITRILSLLVVFMLFYPANELINWISANDNLQRTAEISLNTFIDDGKEFPTGEYVELEVRWIIGPYASTTESNTLRQRGADTGLTVEGKKIKHYYAILEDDTIMSIATAIDKEKQILNRMSDWLLNVEGYPTDGETLVLQGKLKNFDDKEILGFYKEGIEKVFGLDPDSSDVRTVMLDTGSGRFGKFIVIAEIVVTVILLIILLHIFRKKLKARKKRKGRKKR